MPEDRKQPYFMKLLAPLAASGLPLPDPIQRALAGEPVPLATSTRLDLPAWAGQRGYSDEQVALLRKVVGALVGWFRYRQAVAEDLSIRYDLDGRPAGEVCASDRHAAALGVQELVARKQARDKPAVSVDALLAPADPSPPPAPPSRPAVMPAPVAAAIAVNAIKPTIGLAQSRTVASSRTVSTRTVDQTLRKR